MSRPVLTHAPGDAPYECWSCFTEGDENDHHTDPTTPSVGLGTVAEVAVAELICWCGHSLHYPDCPEDGDCHLRDWNGRTFTEAPAAYLAHPAACRDRYAAETAEGERIR